MHYPGTCSAALRCVCVAARCVCVLLQGVCVCCCKVVKAAVTAAPPEHPAGVNGSISTEISSVPFQHCFSSCIVILNLSSEAAREYEQTAVRPSMFVGKVAGLSVYLPCVSGLTTEGLYRVSGNKTDQDNIQKQFDQGTQPLV